MVNINIYIKALLHPAGAHQGGSSSWQPKSVNRVSIGSDNGLSPFGTKQLSQLMLDYCQLHPKEQTSVKF